MEGEKNKNTGTCYNPIEKSGGFFLIVDIWRVENPKKHILLAILRKKKKKKKKPTR
jgi:hypothetical protein